MSKGNVTWGRRLKEARLAIGLSQKELGILAELDEFVASTRINRYELGVHKADYQISQRLAEVLNVPTGYFYTEEDQLAELVLIYHRLGNRKKNELIKFAKNL
ncbi:helix-turn-helix domain-containing protein [Herbaspirillum sp. RV1423]|uniref:helix-turn-helix domain-containing protein n=1 Tax=Herbaspirillum sp. RV1423 TaxID=1443993 RepID=UPI0005577F62|nr:helix-turn-helix transcriptional regulator [Herbaspirillum sp. RV1423]